MTDAHVANHARFSCEPDPENPGWHRWSLSDPTLFLEAVQPRTALVQAGYRNRFGHPAPEVLQRYRERHIQVVESPRCGAATWSSLQPAGVGCEREAAPRYWHHRIADRPD